MEGLVAIRLLDRDRRSVVPTAGGQKLIPPGRRAVDAVDAAIAAVIHQSDLTVDVLDEHLSMLPALRALNAGSFPARLTVVMRADTASALATLRSGAADLVLGWPGPMESPWPADIRGTAVH